MHCGRICPTCSSGEPLRHLMCRCIELLLRRNQEGALVNVGACGSTFRRPAPQARPGGSATSGVLHPTVAAQAGRVPTKLSRQPEPDRRRGTSSKPRNRVRPRALRLWLEESRTLAPFPPGPTPPLGGWGAFPF